MSIYRAASWAAIVLGVIGGARIAWEGAFDFGIASALSMIGVGIFFRAADEVIEALQGIREEVTKERAPGQPVVSPLDRLAPGAFAAVGDRDTR